MKAKRSVSRKKATYGYRGSRAGKGQARRPPSKFGTSLPERRLRELSGELNTLPLATRAILMAYMKRRQGRRPDLVLVKGNEIQQILEVKRVPREEVKPGLYQLNFRPSPHIVSAVKAAIENQNFSSP